MYNKKHIRIQAKTWKYRFKSMGILGIVPILFWLVVVPILFSVLLHNSDNDFGSAYAKLFFTIEMVNVLLSVYWQMLMLEPYFNNRTKEYFASIFAQWSLKDKYILYGMYSILYTLVFGYVAIIANSFVESNVLVKDLFILLSETLFVQSIFQICSSLFSNTLFSTIVIVLLLIQQKQNAIIGYEWLWFINGSTLYYPEEFGVKVLLFVLGIGTFAISEIRTDKIMMFIKRLTIKESQLKD